MPKNLGNNSRVWRRFRILSEEGRQALLLFGIKQVALLKRGLLETILTLRETLVLAPTVSVCLPVYNGSQFLREAIASVLNQTFDDFELIICDDNSDDASREIIEDFSRQDARIKQFSNERRVGLFANYNRCLRQASGKYIKPFAQDDILFPNAIKTLRRVLEDHPHVVLASSPGGLIGAQGEAQANDFSPDFPSTLRRGRPVSGDVVIQQSLVPIRNFIGEPVRVMFRKVAGADGFDERYHHLGDLECWLRILRNGHCYFLEEELCSFRKHEKSRTALNIRELFFATDMLRLATDFASEAEEIGYNKERFLDRCVIDIGKHVSALEQKGERFSCDSGEQSLDEHEIAFRKLAYHSLRLIGRGEFSDSSEYRLSHLVRHRERALRKILRSRSWRWTRFMRELKSKHRRSTLEEQLLATMDSESTPIVRDLIYLRYLRVKILSIRGSLSWMISHPLRLLKL